ncbi:hypothetical protein Syun_011709 [Stephania yunnanensis]|uniref:Uncharacterized protein n=1 Tax=Stephania yunnanensis TaxID=152371 RepID=A0AAP0JYT1_9MAGN
MHLKIVIFSTCSLLTGNLNVLLNCFMRNYPERSMTGKSNWSDDEGDWLATDTFPSVSLRYLIVAFLLFYIKK